MAGRRLVEHAWRWSMIYSIRPKTAQPAPAAPAPGSPHSLHWVTLSRDQESRRPGELPLQMSGWRAASGGGGGGDTWTHTRHTKTSSQWCGTVVHTAACNQRQHTTYKHSYKAHCSAICCHHHHRRGPGCQAAKYHGHVIQPSK